jgi:hypothetical protein
MSIQKVESLKIGAGTLQNTSSETQIWASSYKPERSDLTGDVSLGSDTIINMSSVSGLVVGMLINSPYFAPGTYIIDIVDATTIRMSQTATGSATTQTINLSAGKDGDVWFYVSGSGSDQFIKNNGIWRSVLGVPVSITLTDNTVGGIAMSMDSSAFKYIDIKYSLVRGSNSRMGKLHIISDGGVQSALVDSEVVDIGSGIGVTFDTQMAGGIVDILYTSDSQPSYPTFILKVSLKGWA